MAENSESDAIERMQARLVTCQRLALLGRLSGIITHEVNNHLTGVSGYVQLLLGQERAKVVQRELDKISTSASRCQQLISDLRRIGRFGDKEREFDNINIIVKSSLDFLRHQFTKKSFLVAEDYSSEIPPIEVDTPALEQVFLNIIQNSLEALEEKGNSLTITTRKENNWIVALFEDDGPGLSDNARAHLFFPFFTTKARLRCSGLGLTAAKMLVEAHHGKIEVNDSPTGGTSVKISLPCESNSA